MGRAQEEPRLSMRVGVLGRAVVLCWRIGPESATWSKGWLALSAVVARVALQKGGRALSLR